MHHNPDAYRQALANLADDAETLQTMLNEFIGRSTMARLELPASLYDANAELLLVPARLRDAAAGGAHPGSAFRRR